ncbi:MAG: hypothetical protein Hals2KO_21600 [Halioglobus sp.]
MSDFHDDMRAAVDEAYDTFGVASVFVDLDECRTEDVVVVISHDLSEYGDDTGFTAGTVLLCVRKSQLAAVPRRDESFALADSEKQYTVLQRADDTEFEHKLLAS